MPNVTSDELTKICLSVFDRLNILASEAEIVTRSMVDANLVGHDSHGVIHLPKYVKEIKEGLIVPGASIDTIQESASISVLDGNWGFGPVIATHAVELAIQKARQTDVSTVTVSQCNEIGRLGGYVCLAAEADMIGILMVNDHGGGTCVAPYGGTEGRLSTNPLACAVPIDAQNPIVLDMSTSVVASGKIRVKQHLNEPAPEGWLINTKGKSTINVEDFYKEPPASILPFGGIASHKGFGLSVIVDILAGALSKAGCSSSDTARVGNGLFILVINVATFRKFSGFSAEVERFVDYLKSAKSAEGVDTIQMPGERGWNEKRKRERDGIPIDEETWKQIQELV